MKVLNDRVALVTGAGRGIGRAAAVALSEAGAAVVVNDLHEELASATVEAIRAAGGRALAAAADVSDLAAVEAIVARGVAEFGRLDVAVANAVYSDRELFYQADLRGFERTIDVTMWGAFYVLRAATRQMLTQGGGGSIVVVSSPHAFVPVPRAMAYNMAKAAVDQMARTAATELLSQRIRVNILHPGWTDTPGERKFTAEEQLLDAGSRLPWGRLATPEEIARGIVFLSDPASDYITGSTLRIDGGNTLPYWASRGTGSPT